MNKRKLETTEFYCCEKFANKWCYDLGLRGCNKTVKGLLLHSGMLIILISI